MGHRFAIRRDTIGLWEVYDIDDDDGATVLVEGVPLVCLQDDEALVVLGLLKGGFVVPSKVPKAG